MDRNLLGYDERDREVEKQKDNKIVFLVAFLLYDH
jgi:hypothetical protein